MSRQRFGSRLDRAPSPTLGQLASLSLQARYEEVLRFGSAELAAAVESLRYAHPGGRPTPTRERLAWAVAFNVQGPPDGEPRSASAERKGIVGYLDRWRPDASWATVWGLLVASRQGREPHRGGPLLRELALSVACERRQEWQHPDAQPLDLAAADGWFEVLYSLGQPAVLGYLRKIVKGNDLDVEDVAIEAWSRAFAHCWSVRAERRFLGLSRVSTLICTIARFVLLERIRDRKGDEEFSEDDPRLFEMWTGWPNPERRALNKELRELIRQCFKNLPARQRLVASAVWLGGYRAARVAEALKITRPAVSQHLAMARGNLRRCLNAHDVELPDWLRDPVEPGGAA